MLLVSEESPFNKCGKNYVFGLTKNKLFFFITIIVFLPKNPFHNGTRN